MNRLHCTIVAIVMAAIVGCTKGTSTAPSTNPNNPDSARKLTITSPGDQTVREDRTDEMTVQISRKNFNSPVDIELRNLPDGVSVVTKDLTIPADKNSLVVTIKAAPDAKPVEKHKVTAVAKAKGEKDMPEATVEFVVQVKPKS